MLCGVLVQAFSVFCFCFEKVFLCFGAPQTMVGFAQFVQSGKERIFLSKLFKVCNCCKRKLNPCIDQFFASRNFRQMLCCFRNQQHPGPRYETPG